ncbi:MAG: peptidoglycan DD-metalloendopeptidase family protein [Kofleriaceae bacterium]
MVAGTTVRVYCSADCLRARDVPIPPAVAAGVERPKRRTARWVLAGVIAGGACLAGYQLLDEREPSGEPALAAATLALPVAAPPVTVEAAPAPEASERTHEEDKALLGELMRDAWIHPLAGPHRRMPVNHNGAFGAARAGERPPECASGHCGVDLGHVWGEPVHAVHDGVVEWVNRGPNEDNGGIFVKVAHRKGSLYSWYFHLAAVPRAIRPGVKISAGQVIGLLGDTGIKHSRPHLHFAMSVKPANGARERYLDPEPLIAIWPLWLPNESKDAGRPTVAAPGVPVRAPARRRSKAKPAEPSPDAGSNVAASSSEPVPPASTEPASPEPASPGPEPQPDAKAASN